MSQLLDGTQSPRFRCEVLNWVVNLRVGDDKLVIDGEVQELVVSAIFDLLRSDVLESSDRRQLFWLINRKLEDVIVPLDIVEAEISSTSESFDWEFLDILEIQKQGYLLLPYLGQLEKSSVSTDQKLTISELATRFGYFDLALNVLRNIIPENVNPYSVERYVDQLRDSGAQLEAQTVLQDSLIREDVPGNLKVGFVRSLFEWGALSRDSAYDLISKVSDGDLSPEDCRAFAHLELSELGVLPDDASVLVNALDAGTFNFETNIRICRVLIDLEAHDAVRSFLTESVSSQDLKKSLPACVELVGLMPNAVGLETIKTALSAFGEFDIEPLVKLCREVADHPVGNEIQEEVLAFVSYCDLAPNATKEFAKGLVQAGLPSLAHRFSHWLVDINREELIEDWGMEHAEADVFLLDSEDR